MDFNAFLPADFDLGTDARRGHLRADPARHSAPDDPSLVDQCADHVQRINVYIVARSRRVLHPCPADDH